jgi:hypothetical protein
MKTFSQMGVHWSITAPPRRVFPDDHLGHIMEKDLSRQRFVDPLVVASAQSYYLKALRRVEELPHGQEEIFWVLAAQWTGSLNELFDAGGGWHEPSQSSAEEVPCTNCRGGYYVTKKSGMCRNCRKDPAKGLADWCLKRWDIATKHIEPLLGEVMANRWRLERYEDTLRVAEKLEKEQQGPAQSSLFDEAKPESLPLRSLGPGWTEYLVQLEEWRQRMVGEVTA